MQDDGIEPGIATLRKRATIAELTIYAAIAVFFLILVGEVLELVGVIDLIAYDPPALVDAYTVILIANLPIFLISAIAISFWLHRAHANLHEAGIEGLEYTPGWGVGWYFVPFASLIKPFQSMKELWNESHRVVSDNAGVAPGNLALWWGLWLVGGMLGNISGRMALSEDISIYEASLPLGIVSSVGMIGAAVMILLIVKHITKVQGSLTELSKVFE